MICRELEMSEFAEILSIARSGVLTQTTVLQMSFSHRCCFRIYTSDGPSVKIHRLVSSVLGAHTGTLAGGSIPLALMMSAALSASMMVGAFRFPLATLGMMDASTTRRLSTPTSLIHQRKLFAHSLFWKINSTGIFRNICNLVR